METGRLLKSVAVRYRLPGWKRSTADAILSPRQTHHHGGRVLAHIPSLSEEVSPNEPLALLEAILLLSTYPLSSRKLAQFACLADGTKARTLVRTLNRRYDAQGSAFRVEEAGGGFQLYARSKFAPWLRRLQASPVEVRLSGPALETLAVIAYRQPVLRAEIEAIRGVQSGEVLRQLIERDLVRVVGRSSELGRPFLYGTTKGFLQVFGLRHIDELPRIDELRTGEPADRGPVPLAGSMAECSNSPHHFPEAEEEKDVKILTTIPARPQWFAEEGPAAPGDPAQNELLPHLQSPTAPRDDDDEHDADDDEDYEDEDLDDDEDFDLDDEEELEDDEDDEEDEDEELENEWEEVEDDEGEVEDDEEEDWDDEDWEDDEDWDEDEDDQWDDEGDEE